MSMAQDIARQIEGNNYSDSALSEMCMKLAVDVRVERIANLLDSKGMHDAAFLVRKNCTTEQWPLK